MMIGGSLIQGVSAIQQGNTQAAIAKAQGQQGVYAAQAQQRQDEIQAQDTMIAAHQQEASRYEDLARTLGVIQATIGSRGLDPNSPSAMALEDAADTYAQRDIRRMSFNAMQDASNYRLHGATVMQQGNFQNTIMRAKASAARAAGYTSATSSLLKAAKYADDAKWFS
jgi:hypothetical protein